MGIDYRTMVWNQYGAALDMFADVLRLCPDNLWTAVVYQDPDDARLGQFWYLAAHTLLWADLFRTGSAEGFAPPPPFLRGRLPDQPYTQEQVFAYLHAVRAKCQATLAALTDEQAQRLCVFAWMQPSFLELQMYAMRHVQEHTAQLNLLLGQHEVQGMDWVATARDNAA
jgi:hypothetical protein